MSKTSERKIYRPGVDTTPRHKEWVSLPGGDICIWEMTVADTAQVLDRSERPNLGGQVGGQSKGRGVAMQIMLSCYDGEGPEARRIFTDADIGAIYDIPFSEFDILYSAINRVNGKEATEQERIRDFSSAMQAVNNS